MAENRKLLSTRDVTDKIGISRSTLNRYVRSGRFPKPMTVFVGCNKWRESVVDDWIEQNS